MSMKPGELHAELNNLAFSARNIMNGVNWFREKWKEMPGPHQGKYTYELRMIYGNSRRMLAGCRRILVGFPGIADHQEKLIEELLEIIDGLEGELSKLK